MIIETRICTKCEVEKPLNDKYFNKNKSKSGFNTRCKACIKEHYENNKEQVIERAKEYYQNNKIKILKQEKEYQQSNKEFIAKRVHKYYQLNKEHKKRYNLENKESRKEYRSIYYQLNKERFYKYDKERYENNKERSYKYNKEYKKNNRPRLNALNQKRRAIKKQLPHTLTLIQWGQIKNKFNNSCAYCGKELPLAQEHFLALSKGGEYTVNNIIPSCKICNSSKFNNDFFQWYPKYKYYSKKRECFILKFLNYKDGIQQLKII
jgi:superfamily II DNA helicase RecQ